VRVILGFCALCFLSPLNRAAAQDHVAGAPAESQPRACRVSGVDEEVRCAVHLVREDRDRKAGRRIPLNVVILPALDPKPARDPLFVLAGGPGESATRLARSWARLSSLRRHRDMVLVDQRGTGQSNPLDCDFYGAPPNLQTVVSVTFPVASIRTCRERLERVADLRLYTTSISVDDVDEVRQWLGYDKINLFGGSYGSRVAQVYLRRHGSTVRTIVLGGVLPVDELVPLHHAAAGQAAVDTIFARCRARAACAAAHPSPETDLRSTFQHVRDGAEVEISDEDGRRARVRPSASAVADGLRHFLYRGDGDSLLALIHDASRGDLTKLVQVAATAQIEITRALAMGMNLSVTCSEDIPNIDDETLARETANTFLGDLRVQEQRAACREWVRGVVPKDIHTLVTSTVPALLISGARDPVTPPSFGDRVARQLRNSRHVIFPMAGHLNWGQCGTRIIADFVDRGSLDGLDLSCV
jgi:pimeloyl-ACP methyl ester carboxylesterase